MLRGTKCRSLDKRPTVLLIFKRIVLMWLFQESLWSIRTPKYFTTSLNSKCEFLFVLALWINSLGVKESFFSSLSLKEYGRINGLVSFRFQSRRNGQFVAKK